MDDQQFEPTPQPVYTVRYTRVTQRPPYTSSYGFSYSSYTPYPDTSSQEVGPFDTKEKAEQALFAVLSSPSSKDCSIKEWASLQDYQDWQDTQARMRMERFRAEYERMKEVMEKREAAEPEPKKKRWWQ